jgi:hypothetical protein
VLGVVHIRFPVQTLAYLDKRDFSVHGVRRSAGGIRALGILFTVIAACGVTVGVLGMFGVINLTSGS